MIGTLVISLVTLLALPLLLFVAGRWVHCNAGMVSGYWAGTWVLLSKFKTVCDRYVTAELQSGGLPGERPFTELQTWILSYLPLLGALGSLSLLILVLLVLVEVVHLVLGPAGSEGRGWAVRRAATLWGDRNRLGAIALALLVIGAAMRWGFTASLYGRLPWSG